MVLISLLLVSTGMPLLLLACASLLSRIIGGFTHTATRPIRESRPHLLIQITTRDCPDVLHRAIESIRLACRHVGLETCEIWVVTEQEHSTIRRQDARLVFVPRQFDCGARHKARALEFARQVRLQEGYEGWIYFMDEENWLSTQTIRAILHCIDRDNCDLSTGPVRYVRAGSAVPWLADSVRDAQFRLCHICHALGNWVAYGDNLLVNSALEKRVTWTCASLTEDAVFTGRAASIGLRSSWHGGVLNSVSPVTVSDLLLQRRRWFGGLARACRETGIALHIKVALVAILASTLMVPAFVCAAFVAVPVMASRGLMSWHWTLCSSLILGLIYGSGCAGSAMDRICAAALSGASVVLESASAWWALARPPHDFYIVDKGTRYCTSAHSRRQRRRRAENALAARRRTSE